MEVDSPSARLEMLFKRGKYAEGIACGFDLIQSEGETSFYCFCLGRNFLYMGDREPAINWLERALQAPRVFLWAHYELARLYDGEGLIRKAAENATAFLEMCRENPSDAILNRTHQETVISIAHRLFNEDRPAALPLYRAVREAGFADYLANLRVAEGDLDGGRPHRALQILEEMQASQPLDAWGLFALARAQKAQGDVAAASQTIRKAMEAQPDNTYIQITAAHRFVESSRFADAEAVLETALRSADADHHAAELAGLQFRLAAYKNDHAALVKAAAVPGSFANVPNWILVEAAFTFTKPGEQMTAPDLEVSTAIARHLETDWPYTLGTVLALFLYYSRRRLWDEASRLIERLRSEPVFENREVTLRIFELYCIMSQLDRAEELYLEKYANRKLGQWEACVVLRFLAEAKRWDEAADLLMDFLGNRFFFPDGEHFIIQICRRRTLHQAVLALIASVDESEAPAQFAALRTALVDDLCIFQGKSSLHAGDPAAEGERWAVSRSNEVLVKPAAAASGRTARKHVGFLCADRAYFFSVLTFLASYAANNPDRQASLQWSVFLERSVPDEWAETLRRFAGKLEIPIEIVMEHEFVESDAIHVEQYGIFTGGNTLSRAAYLRIYAANYLFRKNLYERAFYLDTDIICMGPISPFVRLKFGEAAIMARAEEESPEVRDAGAKNGIAPGHYFNSGVLMFDFSNGDMPQLLADAVHLSEYESDRLVFHDQCALNIAFNGRVRYLDKAFNYFLRPHRPDNGDYSSAVFAHFLDKPKPWDVTYKREYRADWLGYARLVRLLVPAKEYNELARAANGGDLRPAPRDSAAADPGRSPMPASDALTPAAMSA